MDLHSRRRVAAALGRFGGGRNSVTAAGSSGCLRGCWFQAMSENPLDRSHKASGIFLVAVSEQICLVKIRQHSATPDLAIRDLAVVKPHWNEPLSVWRTPPQLLGSEGKLFVLVAPEPTDAAVRKARQEHQSIAPNRLADLRAPVLTWPQVHRFPP